MMLHKVCKFIDENRMIEPGDNVILGISGGADSVCLLFVLLEYQKHLDFSIKAIHVNHMIRGEEAKHDENFVIELCRNHNVECEVISANIPDIARDCGLSLEEAGRFERYRIFNSYKADKIAIAHHKNDISETLLFNMVRGSGLKGLHSIRPVSGKLIRPLLCLERTEIEQFLKSVNSEYCIDSTNQDTEYSRNNIRNTVIPALNKVNSKAIVHICELSDMIAQTESYLEKITDKVFVESVKNNVIFIDIIMEEEELIKKRVIKKAIEVAAGRAKDISSTHVNSVLHLIDLQSGKCIDLPYNIVAKKEYNTIVLYNKLEKNSQLEKLGELETILIEPDNKGLFPTANYTKWIDYAKIRNGLELRYRLPGDFIQIKNGKKKLQDFFTDSKIPQKERQSIPLVADGSEIVWIIGHRISENYKVTDQTTKVLEIKYKWEKI